MFSLNFKAKQTFELYQSIRESIYRFRRLDFTGNSTEAKRSLPRYFEAWKVFENYAKKYFKDEKVKDTNYFVTILPKRDINDNANGVLPQKYFLSWLSFVLIVHN